MDQKKGLRKGRILRTTRLSSGRRTQPNLVLRAQLQAAWAALRRSRNAKVIRLRTTVPAVSVVQRLLWWILSIGC